MANLPPPVSSTQLTEDDFCPNTPKIDSSRVSNTYSAPPGRPLNVHTAGVTATSVSLAWVAPNPNGNALVSYTVERRPKGGAWATLGVVPASAQTPTYDDTTPMAATEYEYRVRVLAVQFSAWSTIAVATPKAGQTHQVPVVVSEVRANSGATSDYIELHNPLSVDADVSGWRVTDDLNDVDTQFFKIPANTIIPAGGYKIFGETELGFRLSSHGEEAYVVRTLDNGAQTGYHHGFEFGASEEGVTLGRYVLSTGDDVLLPLKSATPDAANDEAVVGPIVLSQLGYLDDTSLTEYIAIKNIGASSVPLYAPGNTSLVYKINGAGYSFPPNTMLAAGAELYITNDPANLISDWDLPASITIASTPFTGTLSDGGERITLEKPTIDSATGAVVYAEVDWLRYEGGAPWPVQAHGGGKALLRLSPGAPDKQYAIGPEPLNWATTAPPVCSMACQNGGVCVRNNVCDCTATADRKSVV